jgi:hypothetical protein
MITYRIDRDRHMVACHVTIGLRVLDIGYLMERLFADPEFDSAQNVLVSVDEDTVAPDIIARNALAQLLLSWRELHVPAKVGLVLPGSAWRRIATQLIDEYGLGTRNVRCFVNRAEVMHWFQERACTPAGDYRP